MMSKDQKIKIIRRMLSQDGNMLYEHPESHLQLTVDEWCENCERLKCLEDFNLNGMHKITLDNLQESFPRFADQIASLIPVPCYELPVPFYELADDLSILA